MHIIILAFYVELVYFYFQLPRKKGKKNKENFLSSVASMNLQKYSEVSKCKHLLKNMGIYQKNYIAMKVRKKNLHEEAV